MQQIIGFIVRNGLRLLFLLLLGVSLWLTFSHNSYQRSKFINSSNALTGNVYSNIASFGEYFSLKTDNERLHQENLALKEALLNFQEAADSSQALPLFTQEKSLHLMASKVIKNSFRSQKNFLTIKGGLKQGIKRDMGVISDKGIVGIVEFTSNKYATVLSVLNTEFQIVAKVKKNNQFGTLTWDGKSTGFVQLIDIPRIASVTKGDTIVTGFSSKAFPENIPVGVIDKVYENKSTNSFTLNVRLFSEMTSLNHVYVVDNLNREEIIELEEKTLKDE